MLLFAEIVFGCFFGSMLAMGFIWFLTACKNTMTPTHQVHRSK